MFTHTATELQALYLKCCPDYVGNGIANRMLDKGTLLELYHEVSLSHRTKVNGILSADIFHRSLPYYFPIYLNMWIS